MALLEVLIKLKQSKLAPHKAVLGGLWLVTLLFAQLVVAQHIHLDGSQEADCVACEHTHNPVATGGTQSGIATPLLPMHQVAFRSQLVQISVPLSPQQPRAPPSL